MRTILLSAIAQSGGEKETQCDAAVRRQKRGKTLGKSMLQNTYYRFESCPDYNMLFPDGKTEQTLRMNKRRSE